MENLQATAQRHKLSDRLSSRFLVKCVTTGATNGLQGPNAAHREHQPGCAQLSTRAAQPQGKGGRAAEGGPGSQPSSYYSEESSDHTPSFLLILTVLQ